MAQMMIRSYPYGKKFLCYMTNAAFRREPDITHSLKPETSTFLDTVQTVYVFLRVTVPPRLSPGGHYTGSKSARQNNQ